MSNKHNKIIEGEGEMLLIESVAHSRDARIFSEEQESRLET
jgi:hypothetical protein